MKKFRTFLLSLVMAANVIILSLNASAAGDTVYEVDYSLWDKFIKYDLCITDYNSLSDEQKDLCEFIFETEQKSGDMVICERARRTLAGDENIGERLTLDKLVDCYGIWDNYSAYKEGWQNYIHCVPDIIHLDSSYYGCVRNEYWLDDEGNNYVMFNEKMDINDIKSFDVYNKSGEVTETIPALELNSPYRDFRHDSQYREKFGFIEKNGGYYYIKSDGTAVFAWSDYTASDSSEPVTIPFVIENEINGCPVTAIENGAFSNSPLTEIVLPDSIEFIDRLAFSTCRNLQKINFPENLKYIGNLAFTGCNLLSEIELNCPELKIMNKAFSDCNGLINVSLNAGEIGEAAFSSCIKLQYVTVGEDVVRLGADVFENCSELEHISFSKGIKAIGQGAFSNTEIKSMTLLPTIKIIGKLPMKKPVEYTSIGIIESHPLTDEPVCAFDSDCVINGYAGTEVERYADKFGLAFNALKKTVVTESDADGDGKITVSDIIKIQKSLGRPIMSTAVYDINGDGKFDVFDVVIAKRQFLESLNFGK